MRARRAAYLQVHRLVAEQIVARRWAAVHKLAQALLERGELVGKEVFGKRVVPAQCKAVPLCCSDGVSLGRVCSCCGEGCDSRFAECSLASV